MDAATILRMARARSGCGLRELARRAGTSHATLSAYEAGAKVPRADTLERILAVAGVVLQPTVTHRPDASPAARVAKGAELVAALELAAAFPVRHAPALVHPPFPDRR